MQTIAEIIDGLKKGMDLDLNIPDHMNVLKLIYINIKKCMIITKVIQMLWLTIKQLPKGQT